MDDEDAEELRRRLYARDATEEDRRRFREAEGARRASTPPAEVAPPARRRRRRRLAVGGVLVALAVVAAVQAVPRPAPEPDARTIPPATTPAPAATAVVALPLAAVDPADGDDADAVAALFEPGSIAGSRADDFSALVALRVAPQSSGLGLERSGSGGAQNEGLIKAALPDVVVEPGDLLVLTAVTDRPASVTWRFTAADGDRAGARTAILARSPRASVLGGAVRIRDRVVLDGLVLEVSGDARVRYRYAVHRYREPSPFDGDVSRVDLRCAFDRYSGETRCARRE